MTTWNSGTLWNTADCCIASLPESTHSVSMWHPLGGGYSAAAMRTVRISCARRLRPKHACSSLDCHNCTAFQPSQMKRCTYKESTTPHSLTHLVVCALQLAVRTLTGDGVAAFLREAHAATAGAVPERCVMAADTIQAGTFAASASIRNVYGVDATAVFFATPEKCRQHLKAHAKCSALVPVLQQNDATTQSLASRTDDSDITGTSRSGSRRPTLFPKSLLRSAPSAAVTLVCSACVFSAHMSRHCFLPIPPSHGRLGSHQGDFFSLPSFETSPLLHLSCHPPACGSDPARRALASL
jgi:hypothetical protein